mmetsp:Transcript_38938/g.120331  ORF Transcript_38938/g.120331 Transcript_38938/m.120331 type:complete len:292 (+) Transcript_38938:91-966(+)
MCLHPATTSGSPYSFLARTMPKISLTAASRAAMRTGCTLAGASAPVLGPHKMTRAARTSRRTLALSSSMISPRATYDTRLLAAASRSALATLRSAQRDTAMDIEAMTRRPAALRFAEATRDVARRIAICSAASASGAKSGVTAATALASALRLAAACANMLWRQRRLTRRSASASAVLFRPSHTTAATPSAWSAKASMLRAARHRSMSTAGNRCPGCSASMATRMRTTSSDVAGASAATCCVMDAASASATPNSTRRLRAPSAAKPVKRSASAAVAAIISWMVVDAPAPAG